MAAQIESAQREIVLVEDAHIRNGPGGSKERTGLESKLGVGIIGVSAVRGWALPPTSRHGARCRNTRFGPSARTARQPRARQAKRSGSARCSQTTSRW